MDGEDVNEPNKVMYRLLSNMKGTLTTLVIHGNVICREDGRGARRKLKASETYFTLFPEMTKVSKLVITSDNNAYGLDVIKLLRKLPNLQEFEVRLEPTEQRGFAARKSQRGGPRHLPPAPGMESRIKGFLSPLSSLKDEPHTSLMRLTCERPFRVLRCLQLVVESFPNLTHLTICLGGRHSGAFSNEQEEPMTMTEAFGSIKQLGQLERLTISVEDVCYTEGDWIAAFESLKQFPKLLEFSFVCGSIGVSLAEESGLGELLGMLGGTAPTFSDPNVKWLRAGLGQLVGSSPPTCPVLSY